MAVKLLSKQSRVGILKQANWATPQGASANFRTLYYNAGSVNPNPDVQKDEYNTMSANGIHSEDERTYNDNTSGLPTISFAGVADKYTLAAHLVAAMQGVAEDAGTPFSKALTCGGLTGPIDFSADAGFLHTIAFDINASADDGQILENAILETFNFNIEFNSRGIARLPQISGTWVDPGITPYNTTDLFAPVTFTVDSVNYAAQCIRRFEIAINNSVSSNCKTTGGKANQYDTVPDIRSTLILDYNATTEKILGDYKTDALVILNFGNNVTPGTDRYLNFDGTRGRLMKNPYMYSGDFVGIALDIKWKSYAGATPFSGTIVDTVDWSY